MLLSNKRSVFTNPAPYILLFVVLLTTYWLSISRSSTATAVWQRLSHTESSTKPLPLAASPSSSPSSDKSSEQPKQHEQQNPQEIPHLTTHPIQALHQAAVVKFEQLIAKQSKSLTGAVKEYKRRYGRLPPRGFDDWYNFAKEKDSVIIDDFDMINDAMMPFWKVSPAKLRGLLDRAWDGPRLEKMYIENGTIVPQEGDWMGERIRDSLGELSKKLPDLKFVINPLDEPRVALEDPLPVDQLLWVDKGQESSYQRILAPCKHISSKEHVKAHIDTLGIPFVNDLWDSQDVCRNPSYETIHGFMIAPMSFITTTSPVPILSQTIVSTFSDIVYPSMWYWDHAIDDLEEKDDEWSNKKNKLYWVGRTTGGFMKAHKPGEPAWESHRHRFIKITRQIGKATWNYLTETQNGWIKYQSDEVLSQLYDTKFTEIVQCDGPHCEDAKKTYQLQPAEDGMLAFKHKFLMDLDGNSFSGRFYNILASNSCPLKQTIFREWHDERLFPWVHYIPISVGMEELPEAMRYLALTTDGSTLAQKVAQTGKEWNKKMLRKDDATIYIYRLFLEYARIMSDDRDSMNFEARP